MPTKRRISQRTFTAGELSEHVKGRSDLDKYFEGGEKFQNMLVHTHGPAIRRGGLEYVTETTRTASARYRLIPFYVNGGDINGGTSFALILGVSSLIAQDMGDTSAAPTSQSLAISYTEAELDDVQWTQLGDYVYLVHPDHHIQRLYFDAPFVKSEDATDNSITSRPVFNSGPFLPENLTDTTIDPSVTTGSITLTASAALFESGHIGSYWKISDKEGYNGYDDWLTGATYAAAAYVKWEGHVYQTPAGGVAGKVPPLHTRGTSSDGVVSWDYVNDGFGIVVVTAFTSDLIVTADVVVRLPANTTFTTKYWSEGSWSDVRGYPKTVTSFEQRLVLAGTKNNPQTVWGSVIDDYFTFLGGILDTDSIAYSIALEDNAYITWVQSGKAILIGTDSGMFTMSGSTLDETLTPTNVRVLKQSQFGCSGVTPVKVGDSTLYVNINEDKIRQFVYQFSSDSYVSPDLTLLAEHIIEAGVKSMTLVSGKDDVLWLILNDGSLVSMTYDPSLGIIGWSSHIIGGVSDAIDTPAIAEDVATVKIATGEIGVFLVGRWHSSTSIVSIEQLNEGIESGETVDDSVFFDSCTIYDGTPVSSLSQLNNLSNETVSVLMDGKIHPDVTVNGSGVASFDYTASKIVVGFPYQSYFKSMPLEVDESTVGKTKKVSDAFIRVFLTGEGVRVGPNLDTLDAVKVRTPSDPIDTAIALKNTIHKVPFPDGYEEKDLQIVVEQSTPLPLNISSIAVDVSIS